MTAITINIPNHEVGFFKKMIAKMGWTYSESDVVRPDVLRPIFLDFSGFNISEKLTLLKPL